MDRPLAKLGEKTGPMNAFVGVAALTGPEYGSMNPPGGGAGGGAEAEGRLGGGSRGVAMLDGM